MSPFGPKTVEEAQALPEFTGSEWADNVTLGSFEGDTIVLFVDKDGVTKQPMYIAGQWMKMRVLI